MSVFRHGLLPYPMVVLKRDIPKNCEKTIEGFEKVRNPEIYGK